MANPATPTGTPPAPAAPAPAKSPMELQMEALLKRVEAAEKAAEAAKQEAAKATEALAKAQAEAAGAKIAVGTEEGERQKEDGLIRDDLKNEKGAREKEDGLIRKDLKAEKDAREADKRTADGRMTDEERARQTGDRELNKRADDEKDAREKADAKHDKVDRKHNKADKRHDAADEKHDERLDGHDKADEKHDKLLDGHGKLLDAHEKHLDAHDKALNNHEVRIRYTEGEIGMSELFDGEFEDETNALTKIAHEAGIDFKSTPDKAITMKGADAAEVYKARKNFQVAHDSGKSSEVEAQNYTAAVEKAIGNATISTRTTASELAELKGVIGESKKGKEQVKKEAEANGDTALSSQERALAIGERLGKLGFDMTKGNYAKLTGDSPTHTLEFASNKGLDRLEKALEKAGKDNLITSKEMDELGKMFDKGVLEPGIRKAPTTPKDPAVDASKKGTPAP